MTAIRTSNEVLYFNIPILLCVVFKVNDKPAQTFGEVWSGLPIEPNMYYQIKNVNPELSSFESLKQRLANYNVMHLNSSQNQKGESKITVINRRSLLWNCDWEKWNYFTGGGTSFSSDRNALCQNQREESHSASALVSAFPLLFAFLLRSLSYHNNISVKMLSRLYFRSSSTLCDWYRTLLYLGRVSTSSIKIPRLRSSFVRLTNSSLLSSKKFELLSFLLYCLFFSHFWKYSSHTVLMLLYEDWENQTWINLWKSWLGGTN